MDSKQQYKKITIYNDNGEPILTSSNISMIDNRITLHGTGFKLISHKVVVDATGYQDDGIVNFQGQVTLSTDSQLNIEIKDFKEKENRRAFLKVRTDLQTTLIKTYSLGKKNRSMMVNESIEIRDISLGGVGFYSNRKYIKKQKVVIDFNELKKGFWATALILRRSNEQLKRGFKYRYGCQFTGLKTEEQRVILEYVFKKEIENHKKMREMAELFEENQ